MPSGGGLSAAASRAWLLAGLAAQLRHGRLLFKFGLGIAALLFLISLGASFLHIGAQYRREGQLLRSGLWMTTQAAFEAARFDAALSRYAAQALPAWQLEQRFEILYSRIKLLGSGDDPNEYTQLERLHGVLPRIAGILRVLDEDLQKLLAGEATALPRLYASYRELEVQLAAALRMLHLDQQEAADHAVTGLRSLHWTFIASAMGLLLSAGLLIALLMVETRRALRLRQQAEAAAARQSEAERTLRILMDSVPAMISTFDRKGRCLFVNEAHASFHGSEEATPQCDETGGAGNVLALVHLVLSSPGPLPFQEDSLCNASGEPRTLLTTAVAVKNDAGEAERVVVISLDITERKQAEDRIRYLAEHDALTDLPNRVLYTTRLRAMLGQAKLGLTGDFALHLIDLDRFKTINDSLGHPVGDKLLVAAAERMRTCLRRGDMAARIGGDEFAVIQRDVWSPEDARRLAGRLVRLLEEPFTIEGSVVRCGASIGTVLGPQQGNSLELLQQRADRALYHAKAEGRGCAVMFDTGMEQAWLEQRLLEAELRLALERGELTLVYQPKFCLRTDRPVGCEALLRWMHPERGPISPARFVPVAEEAGMAALLARYVLRQACAQVLAWQGEGLEVRVAVNLSAALFANDQAPALVEAALRESGMPPHLLEVELTEGVFIRDPAAAREALTRLQQFGVRVALDDFGTGYSSLSYLQHLPFSVLKVDRAFIGALQVEGSSSRLIVETILRLAHGLGAEVVAEGVETPAQLAALHELGCDAAQGFLLGLPMAPAALAEVFRTTGPSGRQVA
ncbi:EAL domain-containing protein [Roseomonas sp. E05]|uniref:putative bifunctional diguanylate cyclase/phosphodiesterase n=1 Tax=Roseomonas sp. E05 TaxID=3046310 RepID=UPI0024B8C7E5|nr:EAL domain-containing protein [Roseomonas sp. E05]MDJ0390814.1 EAL domain-containing protein [Roseomonas sp. E05]